MTTYPAKTADQCAAEWAATRNHDPKATELYQELAEPSEQYTYIDGSNRDEQRMCDEVSSSRSNQVMRGVLDEAAGIICGDRQDKYGLPEINHQRTADGWNWYLKYCGPKLDPRDVAWLNVIQKISRDLHCRSRDNCVDIVGYAANAAACHAAQLPVNGT